MQGLDVVRTRVYLSRLPRTFDAAKDEAASPAEREARSAASAALLAAVTASAKASLAVTYSFASTLAVRASKESSLPTAARTRPPNSAFESDARRPEIAAASVSFFADVRSPLTWWV